MDKEQYLIIIPCYNEASRLSVEEYESFFQKEENKSIQFLFVNDGSTDNTIELLEKLEQKYLNVETLDLEKNGGKAEAIRQAMMKSANSNYQYIGYFDADLATPLAEIHELIRYAIQKESPYLVMGSRVKLLGSTNIQRKIGRHYIGRVFATVVSNMLKLPIYDTQCGAKLIRRDLIDLIFKEPFLSKWLFDVELFFRLRKHKTDFETKLVEVPLRQWEDKDGSKISTSYFLKAPFDLLKIYLHYR